jgi:hypothetical protein
MRYRHGIATKDPAIPKIKLFMSPFRKELIKRKRHPVTKQAA